jgi:DnaK suppressor protein
VVKTKSGQRDLNAIKDILLERKSTLEREFVHLQHEIDDDPMQDSADQASSSALETIKSSLQSNEYEEYKMIMKALSMIKEGTYGICSDCEEPISEKRLKFYPNAARCLTCQETLEENINEDSSDSLV